MKEENNDGMTHKDMTIEYKVSSFISLHNDISKNLLLPNVSTLNVKGTKVMNPIMFLKFNFHQIKSYLHLKQG
jgi:hypothetical protein